MTALNVILSLLPLLTHDPVVSHLNVVSLINAHYTSFPAVMSLKFISIGTSIGQSPIKLDTKWLAPDDVCTFISIKALLILADPSIDVIVLD